MEMIPVADAVVAVERGPGGGRVGGRGPGGGAIPASAVVVDQAPSGSPGSSDVSGGSGGGSRYHTPSGDGSASLPVVEAKAVVTATKIHEARL